MGTDIGYVGQIIMFAGVDTLLPPSTGWLECDGSQYNVSDPKYTQLGSVIGTAYGGASPGFFNVPDFRGVFPTHRFTGHPQGQRYPTSVSTGTPGQAPFSATLTTANLPAHNHPATFTGSASTVTGANTISALPGTTGGASVTAGAIIGGAPTSGVGAASIYYPSGSPGTRVNLDGGTLSLSGTPNGSVAVGNTGSGSPVSGNAQTPYLAVRFLICYQGVYPN